MGSVHADGSLGKSRTFARQEGILGRFEEAWVAGKPPEIALVLASAAPADRGSLLVELARIDLEYRLKSGQAGRVESYFSRFPELAVAYLLYCSAPQWLVATEWRNLLAWGVSPRCIINQISQPRSGDT